MFIVRIEHLLHQRKVIEVLINVEMASYILLNIAQGRDHLVEHLVVNGELSV